MFSSTLKTLNNQQRHDYVLKAFVLKQKALSDQQKYKRDIDVIREHHRFLWDDDDDEDDEGGSSKNIKNNNDEDRNSCIGDDRDDSCVSSENWAINLARRYYDKLFKEYCIADLTRYKENKIALRWRTETEVIAGTGQFQCGSRKCTERDDLRTWEVNFGYHEHGEHKNALVKLRLCPKHSEQLNYTSKKREIKRLKHAVRHKSKKHKKRNSSKSNKVVSEVESVNNDNDNDEESEKSVNVNEDVEQDDDNEIEDNSTDNCANVWNQKLDVDMEPISRETEFERYLEDLLL